MEERKQTEKENAKKLQGLMKVKLFCLETT